MLRNYKHQCLGSNFITNIFGKDLQNVLQAVDLDMMGLPRCNLKYNKPKVFSLHHKEEVAGLEVGDAGKGVNY